MKCGIFLKKTNKKWIFKAVDLCTHKTVAWVTGNRSATTVRKLYEKLKHLKCRFYTDDWDAFSKVLPKEGHIIGKQHTITIEQDNSDTRHNLARMTRRTKVVSKTEEMLNLTMKMWCNLRIEEVFSHYQAKFIYLLGNTLNHFITSSSFTILVPTGDSCFCSCF